MKYILCFGLFLSQFTLAAGLSQNQYDQRVMQYYNIIEKTQEDLNRALDNHDSQASLIKKSCVYASNLKQLEKLSHDNINLNKAKDEADFVKRLFISFDRSFLDLGTNYQRSCKL